VEASEPTTRRWARCCSAEGRGIEEKDIQTSRLSLQPQSARPQRPVRHRPAIAPQPRDDRVRDVTKVANVNRHAGGRGRQRNRGINIVVSQASKLSMRPASGRGRRPPQGRDLRQAAGVTLGAPLSISERSNPPRALSQDGRRMAVSAPVAQGEETLQVSVSVPGR